MRRIDPKAWLVASALAAAMPGAQAGEASEFAIGNASSRYDFVLRFTEAPCEVPDPVAYATCEGPGEVEVRRKGGTTPLQVLSMESIFVSFDEGAAPLVNSARMYEYQGAINVGDFDFDGHEDFAVQDGNQGPYGGPSYQVFLFVPAHDEFRLSEALTGLVLETLGFFEVDAKNKRLKTSAKGGCCWHQYVEYAMVAGVPQPMHRITEDASSGERVVITEETRVGDRWRSRSRTEDLDTYYSR